MSDYLFTWKENKWPHEKLRALVDQHAGGETVVEFWRCRSHRQITVGDRAYLFKQGRPPRGIFATGHITGGVIYNPEAEEGENPYSVPITFDTLVDPLHELLVNQSQLASSASPMHRWGTQGSGVPLEAETARFIDYLLAPRTQPIISPDWSGADAFDPATIQEARQHTRRAIALRRGQREFREKLLAAYQGRCAITGCGITDLLEAAHIFPFRGPATNHVQNGLLLRSDIHTLFDCGLLAIDETTRTVILADKLTPTSYSKLAGRPLRPARSAREGPSLEALSWQRRASGLAACSPKAVAPKDTVLVHTGLIGEQ
jgi:putative restriction endonuclease